MSHSSYHWPTESLKIRVSVCLSPMDEQGSTG